jgi:hypothetical protein
MIGDRAEFAVVRASVTAAPFIRNSAFGQPPAATDALLLVRA